MSDPLITICIPTFNAERTISQTIDSLLKQTYTNYIIKVFDNCSTDKTSQIIREYSDKNPKIRLIQNETNLGGEGNFTKCIQSGEGDYTALFHSDDIYEKEMLFETVAFLEKNREIGAAATHSSMIDFHDKIIGHRFLPPECKKKVATIFGYEELFDLCLKYGNFITCPSVIARTSIYRDQIKIWNGTQFKTSADLDVWLRLAKISKLAFISIPLIRYRIATDSYSFNLKKIRTFRHDHFIAFDFHLLQVKQTQARLAFYNFLILKDNALRTYNIIKSKSDEQRPELKPLKLAYLKLALNSLWHAKFYIQILGISLISLFYNNRTRKQG